MSSDIDDVFLRSNRICQMKSKIYITCIPRFSINRETSFLDVEGTFIIWHNKKVFDWYS